MDTNFPPSSFNQPLRIQLKQAQQATESYLEAAIQQLQQKNFSEAQEFISAAEFSLNWIRENQ